MSIVREAEAVAEELARHCTDWVIVAECLYGFDRQTAQRLAFVRWLRVTGRLDGDD
jgi:hypothetical protein